MTTNETNEEEIESCTDAQFIKPFHRLYFSDLQFMKVTHLHTGKFVMRFKEIEQYRATSFYNMPLNGLFVGSFITICIEHMHIDWVEWL